ncbi:MAG: hypothetical protein H8E05_00280 [Bacteroidetes bacterium]|nr:hypothetical protein [Bacteroidota bacterium]
MPTRSQNIYLLIESGGDLEMQESQKQKLREDLDKIGELSLNIISKCKHDLPTSHSHLDMFDQAVKINKLAQNLYKLLN